MAWEYASQLSNDTRAQGVALVARLGIELGFEALDENRLRAIQHGHPGHYWTNVEAGMLRSIAVVDSRGVIEVAGGHFDGDLYRAVTSPSARTQEITGWWLRNSTSEPDAGSTVRVLRYLESEQVHLTPPTTPFAVRSFLPGVDDAQWLEVNNRAFAGHPEQGAWNFADLQQRVSEPWFDPSGFLLLLDGDVIVASCWTKIHELQTVRTGEIYVIFTNPDYQGQGLGATILSNGIDCIHRRGVHRVSLFVDDTNEAAIGLYERFGFTTKRIDRQIRISPRQ